MGLEKKILDKESALVPVEGDKTNVRQSNLRVPFVEVCSTTSFLIFRFVNFSIIFKDTSS